MKICFEYPEPAEACATPTALVAFHTTWKVENKIIIAYLRIDLPYVQKLN